MKVLVFIDHDIICRHFVMSGALAPLVAAADVRFIFPDAGTRVSLDPSTLQLGAPFERLPVDPLRVQLWRWALFSDQLRLRRGGAENAIRRLRWVTLGWKAALMLTVAGLPGMAPFFARWLDTRLAKRPNRALADLLDRERPDIIVHPSVLEGVFINDLVLECRNRGVPFVVAMNSWDNPATKRAVVGKPDWLLVWGPQTREHAVRFVGIEPERAVPFGVAQFDVFRKKPRVDRAAFAAAHEIDPNSRIVLFAGSNAKTDEFATLSALDQAIEQGQLPNISIVYRPHPWGEGGRGGARLASAGWHHIKVHSAMREYLACLAGGSVGITLPDYQDTHDILSAVDVVVSPLSTILIEAVLHGKPVAVFAPRGPDGSSSIANKLPNIYFDEFLALEDVGFADKVDDLVKLLPRLVDPARGPIIGNRLREAAARFITPFERPWAERLVDFLQNTVIGREQRAAKIVPSR